MPNGCRRASGNIARPVTPADESPFIMVAASSPTTTWSSSSVESIRNGLLTARRLFTPTRSQARVATSPRSASPPWMSLMVPSSSAAAS